MKTICSCEGITLIIHLRACLSSLWDLLHISCQVITLSTPNVCRRLHDRCYKTGCYFHKKGRLNPVTQEWWGTSELRRQYISPHQIKYYPLFCSHIYINNAAKKKREVEFLLFWFIFFKALSPNLSLLFGTLQKAAMAVAFFQDFL